MKLATAIVFVFDVAKMREFYEGVLGLVVVEEEEGWVRMEAQGACVALHALKGSEPAAWPAREDSHVKLAFLAADVAAERDRLVAAGARMRDVVSFGAISLCDGVDPEGNVFQISSRH